MTVNRAKNRKKFCRYSGDRRYQKRSKDIKMLPEFELDLFAVIDSHCPCHFCTHRAECPVEHGCKVNREWHSLNKKTSWKRNFEDD